MKRNAPLDALTFALTLGFALAFTAGPVAAEGLSVSGRIDVGAQRIDDGATAQNRIDSGIYSASRVTVRGHEDLGGGLGAQFYLEHRFNADRGEPESARFWNGGSYVGLSSSQLGTLTLGRQHLPIFWPFQGGDDTGNARLHSYSAVQSVQHSLNANWEFEDNLIVYKSLTFSHVTASFAIGMAEGYAAGQGDVLGGNIQYNKNGTYVGFGFNSKTVRAGGGGGGETKLTESVFAGMYTVNHDFNAWGNLHQWDTDSGGRTVKGNDFMLGVSYRHRGNVAWFNYASRSVDNCSACGSSGFGAGYHHPLSRHTELYAALGNVQNERNSANGLNGFAPARAGRTVRGMAAGVYHQF